MGAMKMSPPLGSALWVRMVTGGGPALGGPKSPGPGVEEHAVSAAQTAAASRPAGSRAAATGGCLRRWPVARAVFLRTQTSGFDTLPAAVGPLILSSLNGRDSGPGSRPFCSNAVTTVVLRVAGLGGLTVQLATVTEGTLR